MTVNEQLLGKAREESERFAAADRAAQLARADYHTAVRRLHLGGASLREVAQALGMSHQRAQQIVSSAGGTWWQRVWRTRSARRDAVCTFCGRPPSEVEKLIAGPNVFICDACVALAEGVTKKYATRGAMKAASRLARCSFCSRLKRANRPVVASADAYVCGDSLKICREILDAT